MYINPGGNEGVVRYTHTKGHMPTGGCNGDTRRAGEGQGQGAFRESGLEGFGPVRHQRDRAGGTERARHVRCLDAGSQLRQGGAEVVPKGTLAGGVLWGRATTCLPQS